MNSVSKVSPTWPVGLVSGMSGCLGEWILGKSASKTKSAVSKSYYLSKIYFDKLLLSSSGDEYMPDSLYMWKLFEISYHKRRAFIELFSKTMDNAVANSWCFPDVIIVSYVIFFFSLFCWWNFVIRYIYIDIYKSII